MISRSNVIARSFLKSSSFIDKFGKHPPLLYSMVWDKIVLKEEELDEKKWMYIGDEKISTVISQLKFLKIHNDWIPIIKE